MELMSHLVKEIETPVDDAMRVDLITPCVQRKMRWSWKQPDPASFTQPLALTQLPGLTAAETRCPMRTARED